MPEREEIDTGTDKRYIRRNSEGEFTKDQVDEGRSLAADRRRQSEHEKPRHEGDKGD